MISNLWNKIKSALTFNVQQPLLFKIDLLILTMVAAMMPPAIMALDTAFTWNTGANVAILAVLGLSSVKYLLESIAFRPDRYVELRQYHGLKAVLAVAEIHRNAMITEVKAMKKSATKARLSAILNIPDEK